MTCLRNKLGQPLFCLSLYVLFLFVGMALRTTRATNSLRNTAIAGDNCDRILCF